LWPFILKSLNEIDNVIQSKDIEQKLDNFGYDSETDEEIVSGKGYSIRTAYLDEKCAAIHLLGCLSEVDPITFHDKYDENLTDILTGMTG